MNEIYEVILEEIRKFKHEVIFSSKLSDYQVQELRTRGFKVDLNSKSTRITWYNPEILESDTKKIHELNLLVNAKVAYLYTTNNKDLRHITKEVLKNKILNNELVHEFYGTPNKTIISLYYDVIKYFLLNNKNLYLNCGVLTSKQIYHNSFILNNITKLDEVNDNFVAEYDNSVILNDISLLISSDEGNMLTIGTDGYLMSKPSVYYDNEW